MLGILSRAGMTFVSPPAGDVVNTCYNPPIDGFTGTWLWWPSSLFFCLRFLSWLAQSVLWCMCHCATRLLSVFCLFELLLYPVLDYTQVTSKRPVFCMRCVKPPSELRALLLSAIAHFRREWSLLGGHPHQVPSRSPHLRYRDDLSGDLLGGCHCHPSSPRAPL